MKSSVKEAGIAFKMQVTELKLRTGWTNEDLRKRLGYKSVRSVEKMQAEPLNATGRVVLLCQQWLREAREAI